MSTCPVVEYAGEEGGTATSVHGVSREEEDGYPENRNTINISATGKVTI